MSDYITNVVIYRHDEITLRKMAGMLVNDRPLRRVLRVLGLLLREAVELPLWLETGVCPEDERPFWVEVFVFSTDLGVAAELTLRLQTGIHPVYDGAFRMKILK